MKKIIAVLLSASMLCTGLAFNVSAEQEGEDIAFTPGQEYAGEAYAPTEEISYSESSDTISYSDVSDYSVVGLLGALDIMTAAEGSRFKPKAYVSRGEFIEGVLKTLGVRYESGTFGKDGSFYDVDETHPQYAAIATALSAGFISGYDDNTFRPDEVISYNNAVACILKALGFSDDYDQSFANRARGEIIDGISVVEPKAITRMEMAQLLYNTLKVPMRYVAQFATIGLFKYVDDDYYEKLSDETILEHIWNVKQANGLLEANYIESVTDEKAREGSVVIAGTRYQTKDMNNLDWLGMNVTYYYDTDDNLVYMHKHKKTEELIVEADDIIGFNATTRNFSYYSENGKANNVILADNYKIMYNGTIPSTGYDESIFNIKEGNIRLVSNNNSKYTYVFINEYRNFILDKFSIDDTKLKFMLGEQMTYFTVDTNHTYIEVRDGNDARREIYRETADGTATLDTSMFEADSVISVYAPYGSYDTSGKVGELGNYVKIAVSTDKVEGTIKKILKKDDITLTIDDADYKISKYSYISDTDILSGAVQAFYVDASGELVQVTEVSDGDGWAYAYLVHIVYDGDRDYPTQLVIYDTYGSMERYDVTENLRINDKKMKAGKTQTTLEASAALLGKSGIKYQQLIKIKTKESGDSKEITNIQTITASMGVATGVSDDWLQRNDSDNFKVVTDSGGVLIKDNSTMNSYIAPKYFFSVPLTEEKEEKYFDIRSVSSMDSTEVDIYDVDDVLTPTVAIKYISSAADKPIATDSSTGSAPVMLRDSWGDLDEDGMPIIKFEVVQAKGVKEYYTDELNLLDDYVPGDVFYLYGNGTKVSSITPILYNGKVLGPNNLPDVNSTAGITLSKNYSGTPYCFEIYKIASSTRAIMQNGAITSGAKREVMTSITDRNKEWQKGGLLHYKEENGRSEVVAGAFDQCKEAEKYGTEEATKVIAFSHEGGARQIIMYTLDR